MEFKKVKLGELCSVVTDYVANGSFKSLAENVKYKDNGIARVIRLVDSNNKYSLNDSIWVDEHGYEFLKKSKLYGGEIILTNVGANLGTVFIVPKLPYKMTLGPNAIMLKSKEEDLYLYYWLISSEGKNKVKSIVTGSAMPKFNKTDLKNIEISIPDIKSQRKIVKILNGIDKKIELNNRINDNLYNQAVTIYKNKFQSNIQENCSIGDYLIPKRGKNLLSRDAILGDVPVVAGGLEPATYHNAANTKAPVITISASGANAGYINLWNVPVWSSDSSYIDNSITENVYFWYVTLKIRQKEIFDAQTGSAQPHIYPQHIAELPIDKLNENEILQYEKKVTPFFKMIGKNKIENRNLEQLRDTLLPKLMNGEIDLDNIKL